MRLTSGNWIGAIFCLFLSSGSWANLPQISSPLSIAKIQSYLSSTSVKNTAQLLEALPQEYHQNAVLVHTSQSLQQASLAYPRQILFGSDAHLLLAISSVPDDPLYNTIEFSELNTSKRYYEDGRIIFAPQAAPSLESSPAVCAGCHGSPWHPIWGQYPNWPGVYGNEFGVIADEDLSGFQQFVSHLSSEPHLQHLDLDIEQNTDYNAPEIELKNRHYSSANTVMSNTLGDAVALNAFSRLQQNESYDSLSWLLLDRVLHCSDYDAYDIGAKVVAVYNDRVKNDPDFAARYGQLDQYDVSDTSRLARYRLLGIDPATELIQTKPSDHPQSEGTWLHGVFTIYQLIEFQALGKALSKDQVLNTLFSSVSQKLLLHLHNIASYGVERMELVKAESETSWYDLDDLVTAALGRNGSKNTAACHEVLKRASSSSVRRITRTVQEIARPIADASVAAIHISIGR